MSTIEEIRSMGLSVHKITFGRGLFEMMNTENLSTAYEISDDSCSPWFNVLLFTRNSNALWDDAVSATKLITFNVVGYQNAVLYRTEKGIYLMTDHHEYPGLNSALYYYGFLQPGEMVISEFFDDPLGNTPLSTPPSTPPRLSRTDSVVPWAPRKRDRSFLIAHDQVSDLGRSLFRKKEKEVIDLSVSEDEVIDLTGDDEDEYDDSATLGSEDSERSMDDDYTYAEGKDYLEGFEVPDEQELEYEEESEDDEVSI
jgi:hypothetical protein